MYYKYTGGVDHFDQTIAKLRVGIRKKRWWWPLFSWLLNVSMKNAWQVCREIGEKQELEKLDLLHFTRRISRCYLAFRSLKKRGSVAVRSKVPTKIGYDEKNHLVTSCEAQVRCAVCSGKIKRKCRKCDVGLHIDCFVPYLSK